MTNIPRTLFGAEVRTRRRQRGMRQSALASAAGLSLHAVHEIESGKTREPSLMTVLRLCQALDMSPNEMAACFGMWHRESSYGDRLTEQT